MAKTQHYGIKFPINITSDEKTLVDLNLTRGEMVKSELMHLIFTPVGQMLRNPTFGTRLIQFLFSPNDGETWGNVVDEIRNSVTNWIPDCKLNDIDVYEADNGLSLLCDIKYTVQESDGTAVTYQMVTKI